MTFWERNNKKWVCMSGGKRCSLQNRLHNSLFFLSLFALSLSRNWKEDTVEYKLKTQHDTTHWRQIRNNANECQPECDYSTQLFYTTILHNYSSTVPVPFSHYSLPILVLFIFCILNIPILFTSNCKIFCWGLTAGTIPDSKCNASFELLFVFTIF